MAGFQGGFAAGLGPVLWVLIAETFPTARRSQSLGALNTLNAFVNLAVVASGLFLVNALVHCPYDAGVDDDSVSGCGAAEKRAAVGELLLILASICALTAVFSTLFVKETTGTDLRRLDRRYACGRLCADPIRALGFRRDAAAPPRRPAGRAEETGLLEKRGGDVAGVA